MQLENKELTDIVLRSFYKVYKTLGYGFLEKVYENALFIELKATSTICEEHEYQLINYLQATGIKVGLLLNFGRRPEFRRKIF